MIIKAYQLSENYQEAISAASIYVSMEKGTVIREALEEYVEEKFDAYDISLVSKKTKGNTTYTFNVEDPYNFEPIEVVMTISYRNNKYIKHTFKGLDVELDREYYLGDY